jgi:hypothetical protein
MPARDARAIDLESRLGLPGPPGAMRQPLSEWSFRPQPAGPGDAGHGISPGATAIPQQETRRVLPDGNTPAPDDLVNANRVVVQVLDDDIGGDGAIDSRATTTTSYDAHGRVIESVTAWDDHADGLIEETDTTAYEYDQRGRPVSYLESNSNQDRFLVTSTYDHTGRLSQSLGVQYSLGALFDQFTLTVTYDQHGNVTGIVRNDDFTSPGGYYTEQTWTYAYDDHGNPVRVDWVGTDGTNTAREHTVSTYSQRSDRLTYVDAFDANDDGGIDQTVSITDTYDQRDRLVRDVFTFMTPLSSYRTTVTNEYDSRGLLVRRVQENDNGVNGTVDGRSTTTDTYDQRGHLLSQEVAFDAGADGTIESRDVTTDTYDQRGDLVQQLRRFSSAGSVVENWTTSFTYEGPRGMPSSEGSLAARPERFVGATDLEYAVPNPFPERTAIRYELAATQHVELRVFDIGGRLVNTLIDGVEGVGEHQVVWDSRDSSGRAMPRGAYFVQLKTPDRETSKVLLLTR